MYSSFKQFCLPVLEFLVPYVPRYIEMLLQEFFRPGNDGFCRLNINFSAV